MKTKHILLTLILPALLLGACNASTNTTAPISTPLSSPSSSTSYTIADVSSHNTRSSCWVVVNNNVYDVTSFGPQHPGGDQIYQGCGQDITTYMKNSHKPVDNLLPQFLIGSLKP